MADGWTTELDVTSSRDVRSNSSQMSPSLSLKKLKQDLAQKH